MNIGIPATAGIHEQRAASMESGLRRNDVAVVAAL
jgi:hypothetical protein